MKNLNHLKGQFLNFLLNDFTPTRAHIFSRVMAILIPFNRPHLFHFLSVKKNQVCVKAPFIKKNLNHIKSMHACTIATVGELCAGTLLIKNFGMNRYRYIMSSLHVDYTKQGKTDLFAKANLEDKKRVEIYKGLQSDGLANIFLETNIYDDNEQVIALVKTQWQIKAWSKVKTTL